MAHTDDEFDRESETESFTFEEMFADLKAVQRSNIGWLIEEIKLQFDYLKEEHKDLDRKYLIEIAEKLIPFFLRKMTDEDQNVREFAKTGLEQIEVRFPELIKKYSN